jgi:hypothetical protein
MRIVWTESQRNMVVEALLKIEASEPHLPFSKAFVKAQQVLSEELRRGPVAEKNMPWLPTQKLVVRQELAARAEAEAKKAKAEQTAGTSSYDVLVDRLLTDLPDLVLDRLIDRLIAMRNFKPGLEELLEPQHVMDPELGFAAPTQAPLQQPKPQEKERLMRVLVVGTLPSQTENICKQFEGLLEIRSWKNEAPDLLRDRLKHSDLVVMMTGKLGHDACNIIKRHRPDTCDRQYVSGGETKIKIAIEKWYLSKV